MKTPVAGMIRVLGAVLLCGIGVGMSGCDSFSLELVLPDGDGCFQQDVVETDCYTEEILGEDCIVIGSFEICETVVIEIIEVCEDVVVDSFIVCE